MVEGWLRDGWGMVEGWLRDGRGMDRLIWRWNEGDERRKRPMESNGYLWWGRRSWKMWWCWCCACTLRIWRNPAPPVCYSDTAAPNSWSTAIQSQHPSNLITSFIQVAPKAEAARRSKILNHPGPSWIILDHPGGSWIIVDPPGWSLRSWIVVHPRPSWTILDHLGPSWIILEDLGLSLSILEHPWRMVEDGGGFWVMVRKQWSKNDCEKRSYSVADVAESDETRFIGESVDGFAAGADGRLRAADAHRYRRRRRFWVFIRVGAAPGGGRRRRPRPFRRLQRPSISVLIFAWKTPLHLKKNFFFVLIRIHPHA